MPDARTLKITISIDSKTALADIQTIEDRLKGLAAAAKSAGVGGGGGAAGGMGATGAAAGKAASKVDDYKAALDSIIATGGPATKAAVSLRRALENSIPFGEEDTATLGKVQRSVESFLAITRKAGGGDRSITASAIASQREQYKKFGEQVSDTARRVSRNLKEIGADPDGALKNTFDRMADRSTKSARKVEANFNKLIDLKKRYYAGDPTVTGSQIETQAQKLAKSIALHRENVASLRGIGNEVESSARSAGAAAKTMQDSIVRINESSTARSKELGRQMRESSVGVARLERDVAAIGAKATPQMVAGFKLARAEVAKTKGDLEDALTNLKTVEVKKARGKATAADVGVARDDVTQKTRAYNLALDSLQRAENGVRTSAAQTATQVRTLQRDLEALANSSDRTAQRFVNMGRSADKSVERIRQRVADIGVTPRAPERMAFGNAQRERDRLYSQMVSDRTAAEELKAKYLKQKSVDPALARAMGPEVGAAFQKAAGSARDYGRSLGVVNDMGEKVVQSAQRLSKGLNPHQDEMDRARRSAYAYTIAGYQLQASFGVITQTLRNSIAAFADFDFTVRRAAGALGIFDQTGAAFDSLAKSVENTAIATKLFDPKTIAQGYYYWGSTTGQVVQSQQDLLDVQKQVIPIMQMAAITQTDLQTSLKGVYAVMQQYAMPMESAEAVTQKLFLVTQKTAAEFPDLLDSFKMVGPIANEIGVSFDEVVGMLGALANAGIKGGMAGRALRQTFIKLTDPTVRASAALDEATAKTYGLGKSFSDIIFPEGKFIGMQKYLDVMSNLTKDLTEQERNRLLGIITTNNELPALTKLIAANTAAMRDSKAGVVDQAQAMYSSAEAAKVFGGAVDNQMQSAQAVMSEFGNVVQSTAIEVGKNIWEMVKPFMQAALEIGKFFLTVVQTNPVLAKLTSAIVLVAGVVVALGSSALIAAGSMKLLHAVIAFDIVPTMFKTAAAAGSASGAIGVFTEAITAATAASGRSTIGAAARIALDGLKGSFLALVKIIPLLVRGLASATKAIATFLLLDPVGWVILLIGGIIWAANTFEGFGKQVEKFNDTFASFVGNFTGELGRSITASLQPVSDWWDGLLQSIADTNDKFAEFLRSLSKLPSKGSSTPTWKKNAENKTFAPDAATGTSAFSPEQQDQYAATVARQREMANRDEAHIANVLNNQRVVAAAAKAAEFAAQMYEETLGKQVARAIGPALANAFRSGKSEIAAGAAENAVYALEAWVSSFSEAAQPKVKAAIDGISGLLKSENSFANKLGQAMTNQIAAGMQAGDLNAVAGTINRSLINIRAMISDQRPAFRRSGAEAFSEILAPFKDSEAVKSDPAAAAQLAQALILLATPGAEAAGTGIGILFLKRIGMVVAQWNPMNAAGDSIRERMKTANAKNNEPFDLSKLFSPPVTDKGGGKQQTALEKALDVARQAADLAENLQKVAGKDLKAMVKSAMGKIAEAVVLADKITYDTTKSFSKAKLKSIAEFSDNSAKVMALISSALDAFDKMTRFKKVPISAFNDLRTNIVQAVRAIETAATSFTNAKLLATAIVFAENVEKVMAAIGNALDVFAKMPETHDLFPKDLWNKLTLDIAQAVASLGAASTKVKGPVVDAAKNFGESSQAALAAIGAALDVFDKVQALDGYKMADKQLWNDLTADIAQAVDSLGRASKLVKPVMVDAAKLFAENVGGVITVLGSAVELLGNLTDFEAPSGDIFGPISERIADMANALGQAADMVDKNVLTAAKKFADKVGPVVSVIGSAVEALTGVASVVIPDKSQIVAVVVAIRETMDELAAQADPKKFNPKVTTAISSFAKTAVDALAAVKAANDTFAPAVEDIVDTNERIKRNMPSVSESVGKIVEVMEAAKAAAARFDPSVTTAVSRVAKAATEVINTIKALFDVMPAQDLSSAGQNEMVRNITESIKIAFSAISSSFQPFVDKFKITGGDIVKNLTQGINNELPTLQKAVDELKRLLAEAVSAKNGIASATGGASSGSGSGSGTDWLAVYTKRLNDYTAELAAIRSDNIPDTDPQQAARIGALETAIPTLQGYIATLSGRAMGGPVSAGQLYRVNERGEEYFRPAQNGTIIRATENVPMAQELTITHVVKGDVSNLTATQVAGMLNTSMGTLATAISTSAKR